MKVEEWQGRCGCQVEAPLSYGAYLCSGPGCRLAVEAAFRQYPNLQLVIKFGGPRRIISPADYIAIYDACGEPAERVEQLCARFSVNGSDDYIREIFVLEGTGAPND